MSFTYEYARPALTVDCIVFGLDDEDLKVMLIERDLDPFAGAWALPGGFVQVGESLEQAARRELQEETGLKDIFLEQLYSFGNPDRDPREHVVSVSHMALVNIMDHDVQAATDARNAAWFPISDTPSLAFDHEKILNTALVRLKGKVRYQPIGFELLPPSFALSQLQHMYETILERPLDKRNFRRKALTLGIIEETGEIQKDVSHRAAKLYRFDKAKYDHMVEQGFNFEL